MKIKDLKPAGYNPRKITDEQMEMLKKSIEEFGDLSGIIFNRQTGNLIGGHQRLKCLPPDAKIEKIKLKKPSRTGTIAEGYIIIPSVIPAKSGILQKDSGQARMTKKQAGVTDEERYTYREVDWPVEKEKAANIAANKHSGEWDDEALAIILKELSEIPDFDTDLIGFDDSEITALLNSIIKEGQIDDDEVPEVPEKPLTKTGDLYILGKHRLLCGDATKKEDIERLMDGKKADMVFTDPPYNVDYSGGRSQLKGKKSSVRKIKGDNQSAVEFQKFIDQSFDNLGIALKENGSIYLWHPDAKSEPLLIMLGAFCARWRHLNEIIWNKPAASLGYCNYRYRHETMSYGSKNGQHLFYGDTTQVDVWDCTRGNVNVNEYLHPTQKPIAVCERAIINSSAANHIILDSFLGSGSTLIACEKTDRICYGMEIDPHYCDVIVTRYCKFIGNNKITKNGKKTIWQITLKK